MKQSRSRRWMPNSIPVMGTKTKLTWNRQTWGRHKIKMPHVSVCGLVDSILGLEQVRHRTLCDEISRRCNSDLTVNESDARQSQWSWTLCKAASLSQVDVRKGDTWKEGRVKSSALLRRSENLTAVRDIVNIYVYIFVTPAWLKGGCTSKPVGSSVGLHVP